ncbi:DUF2092 domain-containing protein [Pararhodonellum marinum]|uniref:DUF2092 domain-containing protein n=1 Tax=Pararhodonellum marinum TaxID=2755358 RepID=UPI0018906916|nr:DUF2092 domain-containing protein [Pararhodonellum marinum]
MKKSLFFVPFWLLAFCGFSQEKALDSRAVIVLDRMSEVIGDLTSCSFELKTTVDQPHDSVGVIREFFSHDVFFTGPDKMHVVTKGPQETHAYWYNGDIVMYYSFTYNRYGFIDAPDNILETIDFVNNEYGVDFPASDFFYPTFTDDLLENSDRVDYIGRVNVDGKECHHIVAKSEDSHIQIWISNDTFVLPMRYVISKNQNGKVMDFEGVFSNWKLNPNLPNAIYDFVVPESARILTILPKSSIQ